MINGGASDNDTRICLGKMAQGNPFQDAENVVAKKKRKRGGVSKGDFLVLVMLHLFHVHSLDTLFFRVISFLGEMEVEMCVKECRIPLPCCEAEGPSTLSTVLLTQRLSGLV